MTNIIDRLRNRLRKKSLYQRIFETPEGREVLTDICRKGYVHVSTFVPGDSHATAMNEGARRLAMGILREVYRSDDLIRTELTRQISEEESS
jgi:hypothetical protein